MSAPWGTPQEVETRRRIKLALWALAYEVHDIAMVPDAVFDRESRKVDLSVATTNPALDKWFRKNYDPSTGMWVLGHPHRARLEVILSKLGVK